MLSVLATTEMPCPPSVEAATFWPGIDEEADLVAADILVLVHAGQKANQFIIIATWPDLKASSPSSM